MGYTFENVTVSIDGVTWTALVTPLNANSISIQNLNSFPVKIRTDKTNAATEKSYNPGDEANIVSAANFGRVRFPLGSTCAWIQANGVLDVGSVVMTYVS